MDVSEKLYLVGMGALTGLVTAAACGHLLLWLCVGTAVGAVWSGAVRHVIKGSKAFFFEKKNQKTFGPRSVSIRTIFARKIKVFCFFSSEKKAFLFAVTAQAGREVRRAEPGRALQPVFHRYGAVRW
jgi:hypothetical protein